MSGVLENPQLWTLTQEKALLWFLVMVRMTGLMTSLPFGQDRIPLQIRAALTLMMATLIAPLVPFPQHPPNDMWSMTAFMITEYTAGLLLGLVLTWILEAIAFGAQLMDTQMGFSFMQILDPSTQRTTSLSGSLLTQLSILLFMIFNLHHLFIMTLVESYRLLPLGSGVPIKVEPIIVLMGSIFLRGLQLAFPVLLSIFFLDALESICAKYMPQLQLMQLAFPIKIAVGISVLGVLLRELGPWLYPIMESAPADALKLLR